MPNVYLRKFHYRMQQRWELEVRSRNSSIALRTQYGPLSHKNSTPRHYFSFKIRCFVIFPKHCSLRHTKQPFHTKRRRFRRVKRCVYVHFRQVTMPFTSVPNNRDRNILRNVGVSFHIVTSDHPRRFHLVQSQWEPSSPTIFRRAERAYECPSIRLAGFQTQA